VKKLDNKMVKEKEAEQRTFDLSADTTIACDCCSKLSSLPPVTTSVCVSLSKISKYSLKKIKQNLAISFAYNDVAISIAAGLLYRFTHSPILTPTLAALGWIVSDSAVFGNSLLVRKFYSKK
jgi:hypothetical protein